MPSSPAPLPRLTPEQVHALACSRGPSAPCAACRPFASPGWESYPLAADASVLAPQGALWLPGDDEPTLEEPVRPRGVDAWSPEAPIALALHPYNRCELWACTHCGQPFLRYTEYGGYYNEQRIRELQPQRLQPG